MTVRVVNLHSEEADIVIDRRSRWGNPYKIGPSCTRGQSISRYRIYFSHHPELASALMQCARKLLAKQTRFWDGEIRLGCWCAPLPCHGDILREYLETALKEGEI